MDNYAENIKKERQRIWWHITNEKEAKDVVVAMQDAELVIKLIDSCIPATFERKVLIAQLILQASANDKKHS